MVGLGLNRLFQTELLNCWIILIIIDLLNYLNYLAHLWSALLQSHLSQKTLQCSVLGSQNRISERVHASPSPVPVPKTWQSLHQLSCNLKYPWKESPKPEKSFIKSLFGQSGRSFSGPKTMFLRDTSEKLRTEKVFVISKTRLCLWFHLLGDDDWSGIAGMIFPIFTRFPTPPLLGVKEEGIQTLAIGEVPAQRMCQA